MVYSYLDAAGLAGSQFTLADKWRSDEGLLAAYDALFDPFTSAIRISPIARSRPRLPTGGQVCSAGPPTRPCGARVLHAHDGIVRRTKNGVQKDAALEWVAGDVAADIVGLLSPSPAW